MTFLLELFRGSRMPFQFASRPISLFWEFQQNHHELVALRDVVDTLGRAPRILPARTHVCTSLLCELTREKNEEYLIVCKEVHRDVEGRLVSTDPILLARVHFLGVVITCVSTSPMKWNAAF